MLGSGGLVSLEQVFQGNSEREGDNKEGRQERTLVTS